ncbi:hypothetical protein ACSAZL_04440 [Methanosarcina sp. T3]|uniref:hypothetical protein n=1 Tax=Methanosarcina sp. T3 TaxID=3439062 RepID=UPI003F85D07E
MNKKEKEKKKKQKRKNKKEIAKREDNKPLITLFRLWRGIPGLYSQVFNLRMNLTSSLVRGKCISLIFPILQERLLRRSMF